MAPVGVWAGLLIFGATETGADPTLGDVGGEPTLAGVGAEPIDRVGVDAVVVVPPEVSVTAPG